jgi:putative serine protease PepD
MRKPALLAALGLLAWPLYADPVKEVAKRVRGSVVLLTTLDAGGHATDTGTGFAIGPTLVATNHHVVDHAHRLRATLADGSTVDVVGVVADDEDHDLALIRLPKELPALTLSASTIEPGDQVIVVGNPLGLAGSISEGIVGAVRGDGIGRDVEGAPPSWRQPLLQITAPISPGSSGSPVVDSTGAVVGVAVGGNVEGQNLNFAIPALALSTLVRASEPEKLVRRFSGTVSHAELIRNLGISLALFVAIFVAFRLMSSRGVSEPPKPAAQPPPRIRTGARKPPGWGE